MKNRQQMNAAPGQPYFKGWFIALQNYEEYEIEEIKAKLTIPLIKEISTYNKKLLDYPIHFY